MREVLSFASLLHPALVALARMLWNPADAAELENLLAPEFFPTEESARLFVVLAHLRPAVEDAGELHARVRAEAPALLPLLGQVAALGIDDIDAGGDNVEVAHAVILLRPASPAFRLEPRRRPPVRREYLAIQAHTERLRSGALGEDPGRPGTWVLDALYRAACFEASARDAAHLGLAEACDRDLARARRTLMGAKPAVAADGRPPAGAVVARGAP